MATTGKPSKSSSRPIRPRMMPVVPDKLDLRDRPYEPSLVARPRPRMNSMTKNPIEPRNQRETNACTGFALSAVVDYLLQRAGRKSETPVSPFMLYSMARRYDEFPGWVADEGSSLRGAMKGWYKHGSCADGLWRKIDMPPPPKRSSSRDWWLDAAKRPLGAYYRVNRDSVTDMHVALAEVGILYASAVCHRGWDEGMDLPASGKKGWIIPNRASSTSDGGHAFAIVGYDEAGFLILNSWGRGWGDGGLATLKYEDWLENGMDCWVAQLGVVTNHHKEVAEARTLRRKEGRVHLAGEPVLRNRELSPFIVNMGNNGELSRTGTFRTQKSDLEALITTHLKAFRSRFRLRGKPVDIAIYAHGGLTGEDAAANTAALWIPKLYDSGIFPIFFMWETDLYSTVKNRASDVITDFLGLPRPTGGLRDSLEKIWNRRLERSLAPVGRVIWKEMKQNAVAMSSPDAPRSGAQLLYRQVKKHLKPGQVRLHLIGHSAGAIVHSHIVDELARGNWRFETVNFMAPAVQIRTFRETVLPAIRKRKVRSYHQFHLDYQTENADPTCRRLLGYSRSLLYLVANSFEDGNDNEILGLEEHFNPFAFDLPADIQKHMRSWSSPGPVSRSTTHGGFDEDPDTMEKVVSLIKGG